MVSYANRNRRCHKVEMISSLVWEVRQSTPVTWKHTMMHYIYPTYVKWTTDTSLLAYWAVDMIYLCLHINLVSKHPLQSHTPPPDTQSDVLIRPCTSRKTSYLAKRNIIQCLFWRSYENRLKRIIVLDWKILSTIWASIMVWYPQQLVVYFVG